MTTGVPQTNIEVNSLKDEGNPDYAEGNIDNIGNSPKNEGNANHDEGNTNNDEGNGPGNIYNNRDSPSEKTKNMAIHPNWMMTKSPSRMDQQRIHK